MNVSDYMNFPMPVNSKLNLCGIDVGRAEKVNETSLTQAIDRADIRNNNWQRPDTKKKTCCSCIQANAASNQNYSSSLKFLISVLVFMRECDKIQT